MNLRQWDFHCNTANSSTGQLEDLVKSAKADEQRLLQMNENATQPIEDEFLTVMDDVGSLQSQAGINTEQPLPIEAETFHPDELIGLGLFEQFPSPEIVKDL